MKLSTANFKIKFQWWNVTRAGMLECHTCLYYQAINSFIIWLAPRAGKMEPSCPLGTTRRILHEKFPRKPYNKSFIDQVCSVKMAGYWLDIGLVLVSVHKHAKRELGQYPAILTSHLVNNPYALFSICFPFKQKFRKLRNGDKRYGNSQGEFQQNPEIVEFPKRKSFSHT